MLYLQTWGLCFFRFVREWQTDVLTENIDKQ